MGLQSADMKLNVLERQIGLAKAAKLYKRNISQNSDEDNAFERLAVVYRSRNQMEEEIRVVPRMLQGQLEYILYQRLILIQLFGLIALGASMLAQSPTRSAL